MSINFDDLKVQGIKFNYYFICKRKSWLFDKGICMEENSDRVLHGKIVHENSYNKFPSKEKLIDDMIKIDVLEDDNIKEVKISSKMKKSDRMQLLYYLYYLKQLGINKTGTLNYVKEKKVEKVYLTKDDEIEIEKILLEIKRLLLEKKPPKIVKLPYCKKCAYYEFCYIKEEE